MRFAIIETMAALALPLACASPGWAQQPAASPSPSPPVLSHTEYVEVTATRIPEQADEVPAAIEVVTGDDLRARGATDLRSALNLATGVDIAPGGDGGPASSIPEFWGLKEFDAFLLVVDGVPWGGAFNPALATLNLADVDRIEVLRGAAPVMYGATSFVGVIHVVHKDPSAAQNVASAHGGSYGSLGAALGLKLPSWGGWGSSLSVDFDNQEFSDERTGFRRGHVMWRNRRASGAGHVWFSVDGTLVDQDPASPHPREGPALSPLVPIDANHNPDGAFLNERRGALLVGLDRPWGPATWTTTASFSASSQDILRGFLGEVEDTGLNARGIREKIDLKDIYFDSHWAWTADKDIKLVVGVDYLHGSGAAEGADFDYHADLDGGNPARVTPPSDLDVKIEDKRDFGGAYGFAEWNPTANLRLEAGLRLNLTHEERGEGEQAGAEPQGEEGVNNTKLSGSTGIAWTAWQRGTDRLRLFANYRNTFKPAAIDFGIGEEEREGEGVLKPETSKSYELGLKARGWDHRVSLEISAFLMDFDNLVVAQMVGGVPGLINAGQERFKGIEAAVAWHHSSNLGGRVTYSLHDAKFTDFVMEFDGVPTQLAGKRLEMSAHHLASAGILYSPEHGFTGLVELNYVGSRYLNKRNTALADGYATLTASVGYRRDKWEARLSGRNLGDRRDPVAESELGDAQYYRLPARRFDISVSRTF